MKCISLWDTFQRMTNRNTLAELVEVTRCRSLWIEMQWHSSKKKKKSGLNQGGIANSRHFGVQPVFCLFLSARCVRAFGRGARVAKMPCISLHVLWTRQTFALNFSFESQNVVRNAIEDTLLCVCVCVSVGILAVFTSTLQQSYKREKEWENKPSRNHP